MGLDVNLGNYKSNNLDKDWSLCYQINSLQNWEEYQRSGMTEDMLEGMWW